LSGSGLFRVRRRSPGVANPARSKAFTAWFFEDRSSNSFEAVYGLVHLAKLCFQVFDGLFMVQDDLQMFEVLSHGIFYPGKCYQHRLKITLKKNGIATNTRKLQRSFRFRMDYSVSLQLDQPHIAVLDHQLKTRCSFIARFYGVRPG
jgi:hypothetical protein